MQAGHGLDIPVQFRTGHAIYLLFGDAVSSEGEDEGSESGKSGLGCIRFFNSVNLRINEIEIIIIELIHQQFGRNIFLRQITQRRKGPGHHRYAIVHTGGGTFRSAAGFVCQTQRFNGVFDDRQAH